MLSLRRAIRIAIAFALPMALAACGSDAKKDGETPKGEPIARIAPPVGQDWAEVVKVTDLDGYQMGNPEAPIKLIEYASLTCPHCADFSKEGSAALRDKYVASGVVSYELRNQIRDGFDLTMAMLVRCGAPESFHGLSEQVWANLPALVAAIDANKAGIEMAMKETDQGKRYAAIANAAGLTEFFASRGISKDQAAVCLAKPGLAEKIAKQSEDQSTALKIEGTPTFFVNGTMVDAKSWPQLEPILQTAGAR